MNIAVLADDDQWKEINTGQTEVNFFRIASPVNIPAGLEACLFLQDKLVIDPVTTYLPVFINSVTVTLKEMKAPGNILRINGWNSFLSRNVWEISGEVNEAVEKVFARLGKQFICVPDEPGFVSARVIAMIINEAYFALEDQISTRTEIDIAMKLGTNYPYGPFEWGELIGINKIYKLLDKLSTVDSTYLPATLLKAAATG